MDPGKTQYGLQYEEKGTTYPPGTGKPGDWLRIYSNLESDFDVKDASAFSRHLTEDNIKFTVDGQELDGDATYVISGYDQNFSNASDKLKFSKEFPAFMKK